MSKAADIMILNMLFILTSLPIITIGTSLTALYSVSLKQSAGTSAYVAKEYFHAWKENFRVPSYGLVPCPLLSCYV